MSVALDCMVENFSEGYKIFFYGSYSNSNQHKVEFHNSKLGLLSFLCMWCSASLIDVVVAMTHVFFVVCASNVWIHWFCKLSVQIVWHHHERLPHARHQIKHQCHMLARAPSCSGVLQVGIPRKLRWPQSSYVALWFGIWAWSHVLEQSFLSMLWDDDRGLQHQPRDITSHEIIDPFHEIRV